MAQNIKKYALKNGTGTSTLNTNQKEFDGMPERTPLGKAAIEYLNCKAAADKSKSEMDIAAEKCVQNFLAENKKFIIVEGRTVRLKHCMEKYQVTTKNN